MDQSAWQIDIVLTSACVKPPNDEQPQNLELMMLSVILNEAE